MSNYEIFRSFWEFVAERHRIWHRRYELQLDPPFTEDEALRTWKFTNVYRRLDYGTLYYMNHVLRKLHNDSFLVVFNTYLYRIINRVDTWRDLLPNGIDPRDADLVEVAKEFDQYSKTNKVFTNAHMVCSPKQKFTHSEVSDNKINRFLNQLWSNLDTIDQLSKQLDEGSISGEELFDSILGSISGVGGFLAYEIWCDLHYLTSKWTHLDENTFTNVGPGAGRGIKAISKDLPAEQSTIMMIYEQQEDHLNNLGIEFPLWRGSRLQLRDIEHSLCEYYKYHKVKNFNGVSRNRWSDEDVTKRTQAYLNELNYYYDHLNIVR